MSGRIPAGTSAVAYTSLVIGYFLCLLVFNSPLNTHTHTEYILQVNPRQHSFSLFFFYPRP